MPAVVPCPTAEARPINKPATVTLSPGEQATVRYTPDRRVTEARFPVVAISKRSYSSYKIRVDQRDRFGPARGPPTDPDDLKACFVPALKMTREMVVQVTRLSSAGNSASYTVQPIGWEVD